MGPWRNIEKSKRRLTFQGHIRAAKERPDQEGNYYYDAILQDSYRIVTGACEQGCKSWMQQNEIKDEPIRADKLLPILERTNAYGFSKFKSLITF